MDKKLQTLDSIKQIVSQIECNDFEFVVREYKEVPFLQIIFDAPCAVTGEVERQYCRKWALQYTMCDSEIVRTAFKASLAAFEHECEEAFTFMGESIYSPHMNVQKLVELRKEPNADQVREPDNDEWHAFHDKTFFEIGSVIDVKYVEMQRKLISVQPRTVVIRCLVGGRDRHGYIIKDLTGSIRLNNYIFKSPEARWELASK